MSPFWNWQQLNLAIWKVCHIGDCGTSRPQFVNLRLTPSLHLDDNGVAENLLWWGVLQVQVERWWVYQGNLGIESEVKQSPAQSCWRGLTENQISKSNIVMRKCFLAIMIITLRWLQIIIIRCCRCHRLWQWLWNNMMIMMMIRRTCQQQRGRNSKISISQTGAMLQNQAPRSREGSWWWHPAGNQVDNNGRVEYLRKNLKESAR